MPDGRARSGDLPASRTVGGAGVGFVVVRFALLGALGRFPFLVLLDPVLGPVVDALMAALVRVVGGAHVPSIPRKCDGRATASQRVAGLRRRVLTRCRDGRGTACTSCRSRRGTARSGRACS